LIDSVNYYEGEDLGVIRSRDSSLSAFCYLAILYWHV